MGNHIAVENNDEDIEKYKETYKRMIDKMIYSVVIENPSLNDLVQEYGSIKSIRFNNNINCLTDDEYRWYSLNYQKISKRIVLERCIVYTCEFTNDEEYVWKYFPIK